MTSFVVGASLVAVGVVLLLVLVAADLHSIRRVARRRWYVKRVDQAMDQVEQMRRKIEAVPLVQVEEEEQPPKAKPLMPETVETPQILGQVEEEARLHPEVFSTAIQHLLGGDSETPYDRALDLIDRAKTPDETPSQVVETPS